MKCKIKEFLPNIFGIIVKDGYDRAMLFCRSQEYYESPNEKFRNNKFSIWDYIEWYSREHNNSFTYPRDWCGFNIPYETILDCMFQSKIETTYDKEMMEILHKLIFLKSPGKAYVIGVDNAKSSTYKHEICHGLYYINPDYKAIADDLTKSIDKVKYKSFKTKLLDIGYAETVIDDEIQAYLMTNYKTLDKEAKDLHLIYKEKLNHFL